MIMFSRRSSRSATAPASGPSSSAVSQTPPTAALCAATPCPARSEARVDSATRLSQSPRLDSDVATHSRRKGLIESTLPPTGAMGGDRKLTALGYPPQPLPRRSPHRDCPAQPPFLRRRAPGAASGATYHG